MEKAPSGAIGGVRPPRSCLLRELRNLVGLLRHFLLAALVTRHPDPAPQPLVVTRHRPALPRAMDKTHMFRGDAVKVVIVKEKAKSD